MKYRFATFFALLCVWASPSLAQGCFKTANAHPPWQPGECLLSGDLNAAFTAAREWSVILNHPTTIAGYGITDGLAAPNNLSELTNKPVARSNLGLGDVATHNLAEVAINDFSNLANPATSRSNLGAASVGDVATSGLTLPTGTFVGRTAAGTGAAQDLTPAQASAALGPCGPGVQGVVPAPGGGTTNFLSANCTFIPPPTAAISTVFGRTGAIAAVSGDYTLQQLYNANLTPQGRLTLSSGTPVMPATVSGAITIYYTPYNGSLVPFYDGTRWTVGQCPEISNNTTNGLVGNAGPAPVAPSSNYDLFVWNNGGTCTLTRGPAWTNNTTRSTGLQRQDGILMNAIAISNGPGALRGTLVGTVASNGSSTIDYIFGGAASGGIAARFAVWNAYNKVVTRGIVTDTGASYSYTATTVRQARGSAGNQVAFLLGDAAETGVDFSNTVRMSTIAVSAAYSRWGVGLDSTSAFLVQPNMGQNSAAVIMNQAASNSSSALPAIGLHVISANESGDGINANQFNLENLDTLLVALRN